jgi:hypothetical protein
MDQDAELLTPECGFDSCWLPHVNSGRVRSTAGHRFFTPTTGVQLSYAPPMPQSAKGRLDASHASNWISSIHCGTIFAPLVQRIGLRFPKSKTAVRLCRGAPFCARRLTDEGATLRRLRSRFDSSRAHHCCSGRLAAKALVLQTRNRGFESLSEHHQFCTCRPVARTAARLAADLSSSLSGYTILRGWSSGSGLSLPS